MQQLITDEKKKVSVFKSADRRKDKHKKQKVDGPGTEVAVFYM